MIILALGILLAIASVIYVFAARRDQARPKPARYGGELTRMPVWPGFVALFLAVILGVIPTVQVITAAVGVPVTFGKVGAPLAPGFHLKSPFTQVVTYPIRNSETICFDEKGAKAGEGVWVKTSEQGRLKVHPCLSYRIDPAKASDIYLVARNAEKLENSIIIPYAIQGVAAAFSKLTNDEASTTKVAELPTLVRSVVADQLAAHGVEVVTLTLGSPMPDDALQDFINAKLGALEKEQKAVIDARTAATVNKQKIDAAAAQGEANRLITESTSPASLCQALINVLAERGDIGTVLADPCSQAATKPDVIVSATPAGK